MLYKHVFSSYQKVGVLKACKGNYTVKQIAGEKIALFKVVFENTKEYFFYLHYCTIFTHLV